MKQIYIQPSIKVIHIRMNQMIMGSENLLTSPQNGANALGREGYDWDDDEY